MNKPDPYKIAYERERQARLLAEQLLDEKTRTLFDNCSKLELTIQELKSTQKQLIQSEKMASLGQIAAGVAHEINNPIGFSICNLSTLVEYIESLLMLDDFILKNSLTIEKKEVINSYQQLRCKEDIDYIKKDIKPLLKETNSGLIRVKDIVSNLNKVNHASYIKKELCDINTIIKESLKIVWNELKLHLVIKENLSSTPKIACRPSEISQVLMNIFVNAAHAANKKGILNISTYTKKDIEKGKESEYLVIEISDNGQGIPDNIINNIFDPFFTTKPVGIGTGLGLSISFGIIKKHNGRIEVTSKKNIETTFKICLPY